MSTTAPAFGGIQLELDAVDGAKLATEVAYVVPPAGIGTQQTDLNVRNGSQPFVDGTNAPSGAVETAPSLKPGQSARYLVRLRNDSSAPSQLGVELSLAPSLTDCTDATATFQMAATVVQAGHTLNITNDVQNGGYLTPVVAAGGHVDVTATVHYLAPTAGCTWAAVVAHTWSSDSGFNGGQSGLLINNSAA
jgi:hypothetical protein